MKMNMFKTFQARKTKKVPMFLEMELSAHKIKKFLIFPQKKIYLIFWETKIPKNSLYFRKQNFLIF